MRFPTCVTSNSPLWPTFTLLTSFTFHFSYNKLAGAIQKLSYQLAKLNAKDPFRQTMGDQLLDKLCVFTSITSDRNPIPNFLGSQTPIQLGITSCKF